MNHDGSFVIALPCRPNCMSCGIQCQSGEPEGALFCMFCWQVAVGARSELFHRQLEFIGRAMIWTNSPLTEPAFNALLGDWFYRYSQHVEEEWQEAGHADLFRERQI